MIKFHLQWWRAECDAYMLSELTPARIAQARYKLKLRVTKNGKPISPANINRYLATLSIACGVALREWGSLDDNPVRKVKKLIEPREHVRFLTDKERARLLEACRGSVTPTCT